MKSPLVYLSRALSDMEDRWIPYSALWWRFWTPPIPLGDRYQEGAFSGYSNAGDDGDDPDPSDMAALDIRRMLAIPPVRQIYKKLPYIDVVPVKRPYEQMTPADRAAREAFVAESTLAAYADGKALYPPATIRRIEAQLDAAAARLARRAASRLALRQTLFAHCEAPQTAFLSFPAYDGVTTHVSTWAPGAALALSGLPPDARYRPGRSQVEFRTIQELTQPDPAEEAEGGAQFAPDSWVQGVGYGSVMVCRRLGRDDMFPFYGEEGEQMGVEGMEARLEGDKKAVLGSGEWGVLLRDAGEEKLGCLGAVDKVVVFYGNGMSDDCDYCKRAMFLLAVVECLRERVVELRGDDAGKFPPIYMPAFDTLRRWNEDEETVLRKRGVEFVESNGEMFLMVDERTLVVSYRNWNPVKQVVADLARPAAIICRPVSDDPEQDFAWKDHENDEGETVRVPTVRSRFIEPATIVVDPDSPRVRKMVADYDRYELPELPAGTTGAEVLSLYVRKPEASTEVEYWS